MHFFASLAALSFLFAPSHNMKPAALRPILLRSVLSMCAGKWPLLHEIAEAGVWKGVMHYGTGQEGLQPAPFTLDGTTEISISDLGGVCILSTVTLPNGVERTVKMEGTLTEGAGSTIRLETAGGPISLLMSEHAGAGTILMREVNRTTDKHIVSSSMVLIRGFGDDAVPELLQTAHELDPGGAVSGVQMWRMRPQASIPDISDDENDEEAYMYSGSEL